MSQNDPVRPLVACNCCRSRQQCFSFHVKQLSSHYTQFTVKYSIALTRTFMASKYLSRHSNYVLCTMHQNSVLTFFLDESIKKFGKLIVFCKIMKSSWRTRNEYCTISGGCRKNKFSVKYYY